jgi:hypothetical protein
MTPTVIPPDRAASMVAPKITNSFLDDLITDAAGKTAISLLSLYPCSSGAFRKGKQEVGKDRRTLKD